MHIIMYINCNMFIIVTGDDFRNIQSIFIFHKKWQSNQVSEKFGTLITDKHQNVFNQNQLFTIQLLMF